MLWNQAVHTDREVTANRPDIITKNKKREDMHADRCDNTRREKCCAKGSGKEVKIQEFRYRDTTNVEPEMYDYKKVKVSHNRPEQTQGFSGRLRPRIFLTFGTTRVVGRQPYAPAAFTPVETPGTHFQKLSQPQGTSFRRSHGKNPQRQKCTVIPVTIGATRIVTRSLTV